VEPTLQEVQQVLTPLPMLLPKQPKKKQQKKEAEKKKPGWQSDGSFVFKEFDPATYERWNPLPLSATGQSGGATDPMMGVFDR